VAAVYRVSGWAWLPSRSVLRGSLANFAGGSSKGWLNILTPDRDWVNHKVLVSHPFEVRARTTQSYFFRPWEWQGRGTEDFYQGPRPFALLISNDPDVLALEIMAWGWDPAGRVVFSDEILRIDPTDWLIVPPVGRGDGVAAAMMSKPLNEDLIHTDPIDFGTGIKIKLPPAGDAE
jgi:hypothetical protein